MSINILGISAFYHDSAACILRDGEIISAAQEERFSRLKHDHNFPVNSIIYCLKEAGLEPSDPDFVVFYDKPFIKFERILQTYLQFAPLGWKAFVRAMPLWLRRKIWLPDIIKSELGFKGKVLFAQHHESHAASAFFPSPFREAAFLTVDGVGEWATTSYGVGKDNNIEIWSELHFPHSLGLLYAAFTYFTGFRVNSGEYKVMGLAPYGEPRFAQKIYDHLIDLKDDGSFALNMKYFNYCCGLTMTNERFAKLFGGPPRKPGAELTQREMDLARSIQTVTEEIILRMARHVKKETKQKFLCLAGGVALNCVANGKLLRSGLFEDIWIQPAAGDAGGSIGAAFIGYYHYLKRPAVPKNGRDQQKGSYLGTSYSDDKILEFLKKYELPYVRLDTPELLNRVCDLLIEDKVIGWFQGRMEFGPRALGNRSIIADARSKDMRRKINLKIKFREEFRPFAPSVVSEKTDEWFELGNTSPYMLFTAEVKKNKQRKIPEEEWDLKGFERLKIVYSDIPAVTHVDCSARVQTVSKEGNPIFHGLIRKFYERTGCPVIVNTSFNVRGEPLVESPLDAYRCFIRTGLDALVMGSYILYKENQPPIK